jgi:hypothetical protein
MKPYHILAHSVDGKCTTNLQKMLEMRIDILRSLANRMLYCTILICPSLSSKWLSSTFIIGLVLILALDGAEKSLMNLKITVAIGTESMGVVCPWSWSMISQTRDPKDPSEDNLDWCFLKKDSGSPWQFASRLNLVMHFPMKTISKHMAKDNSIRIIVLTRTIMLNLYADKDN